MFILDTSIKLIYQKDLIFTKGSHDCIPRAKVSQYAQSILFYILILMRNRQETDEKQTRNKQETDKKLTNR